MLVAKITCPACQATLKPANPIPAGKTVKCPRCSKPFQVAEESPEPAANPDEKLLSDSALGVAKTPALVARISCPTCFAVLKPANPIAVGKTVKCPKCTSAITVKEEAAAEPPSNGEAEPKLVAKFGCPHCQAVLKPATPLPAGKIIKCPKCSQKFPVQAEPEEPPKPAAASADYEVVDDEPAEVTQTICGGCQATLKLLKPVAVGKKIKCPKCTLVFAVTAPPKTNDEPMVAEVDEPAAPAPDESAPAGDPFAFDLHAPPPTKKAKQPDAKATAEMPALQAEEPEPVKPEPRGSDEDDVVRSGINRNVILTIAGSVLGVAVLAGLGFFLWQILPGMMATTTWQDFAPPNGRCEVLMPDTPLAMAIDLDKLAGVHGQRFGVEKDDATFSLTYIDLPESAQSTMFDELYRIERNRLCALTPENRLLEEVNVTASGVDGKECQVFTDRGPRIARIFLQRSKPNPRLFVVMAEGAVKPGDERTTKFFESFKIVPQEAAPGAKDPWTTASEWSLDPALASALNPEIDIGAYKIRPPKFYNMREIRSGANLRWVFQGPEKEYQEVPALTILLTSEKSLLNEGSLTEALDLFIQGIDSYLGNVIPQVQEPSEEGNVNGIRFQRRRFTAGPARGFIYLGRDAGQTLVGLAFDQGKNADQAIKVMNACMLTLRREGRPADPPPEIVKKTPTPTPKTETKAVAKQRVNLNHDQPIQAVALAGDNKTVVMAGRDNRVYFWEIGKPKVQAVLDGHKGVIRALAFSPDGSMLASASADGSIKLWDPVGHKETRTLQGHQGPVTCLAFSPDGKFLVSGGQDKAVHVWDVAIGIELFFFPDGHAAPLTALTISKDGNNIASADQMGQVNVWDLAKRQQRLKPFAADRGAVSGLAFIGADTLATGGADGTIKLWDLNANELKKSLGGHQQAVTSLASDRAGLRLVSASADGSVRFWDAQTGRLLGELDAHQSAVLTLALSPDFNFMATGGADKTLKVWDVLP